MGIEMNDFRSLIEIMLKLLPATAWMVPEMVKILLRHMLRTQHPNWIIWMLEINPQLIDAYLKDL